MQTIKPSKSALATASALLKKGNVIICPTDTLYGFLADAKNKKAVDKIFKIKQRKKSKPLPVFVNSINMARELAFIDETQETFLQKVWPGKVTVILKRRPGITLYGVAQKTIALRIPRHAFLQEILNKVKRPLVQTSVNMSGRPSLLNIGDIKAEFDNNSLLSGIINGGNLKRGKPSKIVDYTHNHLTRLR